MKDSSTTITFSEQNLIQDTEIPWRLHLLGVVLREKTVTWLVRELTTAGVSTVQGVSCLSPGFCPASNPKDQQIQNVPPHGPEVYFSQDEDLEMAPEMFQFGWSLSHIGSLDQLPTQTQLPTYRGTAGLCWQEGILHGDLQSHGPYGCLTQLPE